MWLPGDFLQADYIYIERETNWLVGLQGTQNRMGEHFQWLSCTLTLTSAFTSCFRNHHGVYFLSFSHVLSVFHSWWPAVRRSGGKCVYCKGNPLVPNHCHNCQPLLPVLPHSIQLTRTVSILFTLLLQSINICGVCTVNLGEHLARYGENQK